MPSRLLRRLASLRHTYWFLPGAMTAAALVLGLLLPWLDAWLGSDWTRRVGFLRATQVDGARAILTTLAGAALGVAGVAFSITIVAVSFATANYGPRLIGNFMADRVNQLVLGVLVATFTYCIAVLSTVHAAVERPDGSLEPFVPQISVLFALALTLASVGALIGYIHHVPESINVMNLTARIGRELRRRTQALAAEDRDAAGEPRPPPGPHETTLRAATSGFLQGIDHAALRDVAREHGLRIDVLRGAGEFLVEGEALMTVRAAAPPGDEILGRLRACHAQGAERTGDQDVLFLSDQLVEVAVRALSPGVNDPNTAMLCVDWLRAGLDGLARAGPIPKPPATAVRHPRVTFEGMLERSLGDLRPHAAGDVAVTLHVLDALAALAEAASSRSMAGACLRQARLLAEVARERLPDTRSRAEVAARLVVLEAAAPDVVPVAPMASRATPEPR